nr:Toll/interleukin-1 receptor (TIR) domain-containing protein [Tanacetum cinerariifolium]
ETETGFFQTGFDCYSALEQRLIRTYKDDITLARGESVGPALLKAIEESRHAVIIFSKNYAGSSWCLEELLHIMKCYTGKFIIYSSLSKSNVLIILDDVDDPKQLEALAGSHRWFGDGSRIIITTRNEHLLQKVDYVYPVMLLSQDEGNRLFKKHAYNDKKPLKDYWGLSLRVVSYADGLPLALKVLGSFLYDKDEKEWMSTLDRLKDIPQSEILKQLKISYDGLETMEKELFLDIACFFRGEKKDDKMEILEAFGMYPHIGIKVLIQKSLITIDSSGRFHMHDLVQDMGHYIVRGEHPNNPGKHSRVWKYKEIRSMCRNTTMENDKTEGSKTTDQPLTYLKMVPKRWLIVENSGTVALEFLSNDLQCIEWYCYPASRFPDSFKPTNLAVLKLVWGLQTELWKAWKQDVHVSPMNKN